jgi:hypothetical protein
MFYSVRTKLVIGRLSLLAVLVALTTGLTGCGKGGSPASSMLMGETGVNLLNSVINPHPSTGSTQGGAATGSADWDPNTMDHTAGGMPIEIYQQQQEQQQEQQQRVNAQYGQ